MKTDNVFMLETTMNRYFLSHLVLLVRLDEKLFGHYLSSKDVPIVNIGEFVALSKATLKIEDRYKNNERYNCFLQKKQRE